MTLIIPDIIKTSLIIVLLYIVFFLNNTKLTTAQNTVCTLVPEVSFYFAARSIFREENFQEKPLEPGYTV